MQPMVQQLMGTPMMGAQSTSVTLARPERKPAPAKPSGKTKPSGAPKPKPPMKPMPGMKDA